MKETIMVYFPKDAYYNGELLFRAENVYELKTELGWAQRWINRGAYEVDEPSETIVENVEEKIETIVVDRDEPKLAQIVEEKSNIASVEVKGKRGRPKRNNTTGTHTIL